ncbi:hypothetical protein EON81_13310 [bacterium]|nr:MAG: hypothetical protein EON81_13310 [bacterium]
MRRTVAILLLGSCSLATACLNDRDTVGNEMRQSPEVGRSLIGWFDRLPNEYYQRRIDRLRAKSKLSPNEYDDMAVAYVRMGDSQNALATIDRKAELPLKGEDLYRLHANRGTFLLIRWIQEGARPENLDLLKRGENDIAKAVRLKPGSHFGRESTQLELMRWMLYKSKHPDNVGLGTWLLKRTTPDQKAGTKPDHSQGLAGLISLGAAWEMADTAAALAALQAERMHFQLADFSRLRAAELQTSGKTPFSTRGTEADLTSGIEHDPAYYAGVNYLKSYAKECFTILRAASKERDEKLQAYVKSRLAADRHSDTDSAFWSEWREPAMPDLPRMPRTHDGVREAILGTLIGIGVFLAITTYLLIRIVRGYRLKRGLRNQIKA